MRLKRGLNPRYRYCTLWSNTMSQAQSAWKNDKQVRTEQVVSVHSCSALFHMACYMLTWECRSFGMSNTLASRRSRSRVSKAKQLVCLCTLPLVISSCSTGGLCQAVLLWWNIQVADIVVYFFQSLASVNRAGKTALPIADLTVQNNVWS